MNISIKETGMSWHVVITWKALSFFSPSSSFQTVAFLTLLTAPKRSAAQRKQKIGGELFEVANEYRWIASPTRPPRTFARGLRVHLKGIDGSASALTNPQWDYISPLHLGFVTAQAIMASQQIHNRRRAHQAAARCGRPE